MEKKLSDYLHFYLGCEVVHPGLKNPRILTARWLGSLLEKGIEVKPILRPLSSMSEEEGKELMGMLYKEVLNIDPKLEDAEIIYGGGDDAFGMKASEHEFEERVGLTVEVQRGIELSINTAKMMTPQFQATKWLLSKHFDLFGLIESGLAINSQSTNQ